MAKTKEQICEQSIFVIEINEHANICDRSISMRKTCGGTKEEHMMCSFWGYKPDYQV